MLTQFLQCLSCLHDFNVEDRVPCIIPQCGHTLCSQCLNRALRNSQQKCPFEDKKITTDCKSSDEFPINLLARDQLEESGKWQICRRKHDPNLISGYSSDPKERYRLCLHCVFFAGHGEHIAKLIQEIRSDINTKKELIKGSFANNDEFYKVVNNMLDERRLLWTKVINDSFKGLISLLNTKKQGLLLDIQSFFNQEKANLGSHFSTISLEEHEFPESHYFTWQAPNETQISLDKKIVEASTNFHETLSDQMASLNQLENSNKIFSEKLKALMNELNLKDSSPQLPSQEMSVEDNNFHDKMFSSRKELTQSNAMNLEMETSLEIKFERKTLEIIATDQPPVFVALDISNWKETERVIIRLEKFTFTAEDLRTFHQIFTHLEQIQRLEIFATHQPYIPQDKLTQLLSIIFSKPEIIQEIIIDFVVSQVGDQPIILFSEQVLTKAKLLNTLNLNLIGTPITENGLQALAKGLSHVAKNLMTFELYISRVSVSEETLSQLFIPLPNVKYFQFDLGNTHISDQSLEIFANVMLSSMVSLERLYMWLDKTKVSDVGVIKMMNRLSNIRFLRNFDLDLEGTLVSENIKNQITKIKEML